VTTEIDVNIQPLPGYRLIERLGAGGYGEVWSAEAPGGLTKAIKFVFGQHHEKRASNELRALHHVRGVRHPFMLSLERIEVVDGRLLVVTELADGSVKDRFDACRCEGLCGIPRKELLLYLRDAADALDFMSDSHDLQHLDIKPENLLLLAAHVKVADFGLVKDVRQSQASLVGGMTPLYAAPEVFRGAPCRFSDQYSLAIVYQEMLTGTLPFGGGNAAELTLQHLNDEPDLSPLSVTDRYAVARALSKDPQHRYATCRDFVEALLNVSAAEAAINRPSIQPAAFESPAETTDCTPRPGVPTDVFDESESAEWHAPPSQLLVDLPPCEGKLVDLPPVALAEHDAQPVPTLLLGIGGTGGRVLAQLRQLISNQLGAESSLPAVQFLLVDTDPRAISEASRGSGSGLSPDETLNLPLRRPQHYRERSQQLLHWLSRRWLYNIPRSLRTEGLRPLGRLALADHARQTAQRIRRAMMQAIDPDSLESSSRATGQQFRSGALRVYVVASIAGGTGGGMAIDLAYVARAMLDKLGLDDAQICGVMSYSTGGDPRHCELARVNAFSWLTEHHHFQQPDNAYPGDASCGLPPHAAGVAAFDDTYLQHLGENLNRAEYDQATQSIAEYLRLATLTPAKAFFDACRKPSSEQPDTTAGVQPASLRSFGIYRQTAVPAELCEEFAKLVSRQVLSGWVSHECANDGTDESRPAPAAMQLAQRLQLTAAGLAANARSLAEVQLGHDPDSFLTAWLAKQGLLNHASEAAQLQAIDRLFGTDERRGDIDHQKISLLGQPAEAIVEPLSEKLRTEIRRWLTGRLDDPGERLVGARQAANRIGEHCRQIQNDLGRLRQAATRRAIELRGEVTATGSLTMRGEDQHTTLVWPRVADYFRVRLDQVAIWAAEYAVKVLLSDSKIIADELTTLGREVEQIAMAVERTANSDLAMTGSTNPTRAASVLSEKLPRIVAQVDMRLQTEYIQTHGGLLKLIMQGGRPRAQLTAKLQDLSRQVVQDSLAGENLLEAGFGEDGTRPNNELRMGLASATPSLLAFGGTRRTLAIVPGESNERLDPNRIVQTLGIPATSIHGANNCLTLCVEADRLPLERVALELVQRRKDRVEFAGRVHCRTDIVWTPLVAGCAAPAAEAWSNDEARKTQSRQDMCKTLVM
jgi:eukaryotic-like serine/threonine-protein kinase